MKYIGIPMCMWGMFVKSFQNQLIEVLDYDTDTARKITQMAKPKYRQIITELPEFEKDDHFKLNIVGCAMLGAFILSMPRRPEIEELTDCYAKARMTNLMKMMGRTPESFDRIVYKDATWQSISTNVKIRDMILPTKILPTWDTVHLPGNIRNSFYRRCRKNIV